MNPTETLPTGVCAAAPQITMGLDPASPEQYDLPTKTRNAAAGIYQEAYSPRRRRKASLT